MPHIHTDPGQHDFTISAYIMRQFNEEWKCLVHMHKKFGKLLQVGGHIELHETPWAALMHEIREEAGYDQDQLTVLQVSPNISLQHSMSHPIPVNFNTHKVNDSHYHTDLGYGIIVEDDPRHEIKPPESPDVRWLSIDEIRSGVEHNEIFSDVLEVYEVLVNTVVGSAARVPASNYSTKDPDSFAV